MPLIWRMYMAHQRKQHTQGWYMKENLRCVSQPAAQTGHCVRVMSVCPYSTSHVCCLLSETVALSVIICPAPPLSFQKSSSTTQSPCTPRTWRWNLTRTPVTSVIAQSAPVISGILTGQMRFCKKGNVSLDAISSTKLSFAVISFMRLTQLWSWQEITQDKVG